jgi:hypothetical protein
MLHSYVRTNSKIARDREAADRVAEMMYAALQKLLKDEQKALVKGIQDIKILRIENSQAFFQSTELSEINSSPKKPRQY